MRSVNILMRKTPMTEHPVICAAFVYSDTRHLAGGADRTMPTLDEHVTAWKHEFLVKFPEFASNITWELRAVETIDVYF